MKEHVKHVVHCIYYSWIKRKSQLYDLSSCIFHYNESKALGQQSARKELKIHNPWFH